ncbi:MAG TPA: phytanoyl-CoA dioxygenase family protein [Candidatus Saccharimonadales bacterium]|nr:phytanoyl-CoA dioxygenase family protein [Candidatus Saccharimonadales bacterium]
MTLANPTGLTQAQQRQFEEDGYFFPVHVLDEKSAQHYLDRYLEFHRQHRDRIEKMPVKERYMVLSELHFVLRWAHELVTHPALLDAVESVLGPDFLVWNTSWFTKMPGDKTYVSWHQDGMYWKMSPPKIVTAWLALAPSTPANGCLRVVAGTHTRPALPHRDTYATDNALSRGQDIAVEVDESKVVNICLQPGEASLHHVWTVHGSKANTSDIPRIGLAIRYVAAEVKQESPTPPLAMLVRGQNKYSHFETLPPPTEDTLPADGGRHTEIVTRIRASIMPKK